MANFSITFQVEGQFLRIDTKFDRTWIKMSSITLVQPFKFPSLDDPHRAGIKINAHQFVGHDYVKMENIANAIISAVNGYT
jgi:hypothetical protein